MKPKVWQHGTKMLPLKTQDCPVRLLEPEHPVATKHFLNVLDKVDEEVKQMLVECKGPKCHVCHHLRNFVWWRRAIRWLLRLFS